MSYKIVYAKSYEDAIHAQEDPLVVDIRPEPDKKFRETLGMDYRHLIELANKGENIVIFKNEEAGRKRLEASLKRCKEFERELVIVYDDIEHLKKVKEIINEFKQRSDSIQS